MALKKRLRSFKYAFQGIFTLYRTQPNAQIHFLATVLVIGLGFYKGLNTSEWAIITICIGMVTAMEAMNTALEFLADKVSPEYDALIGKAKDIAAGAVLITAIAAAIVAGLIFLN